MFNFLKSVLIVDNILQEGQAIDIKKDKRFSVTRKKSEVKTGETIVELEIKVGR